MSQEPFPGASPAAPMFREIRSGGRPEGPYEYRSLTPYTWVLLILVGLYIAGVIGAFIAGFVSGMVSGAASLELIAVTSLIIGGLYVLSAIASGFWIYNAACNARALGGRGFEVSPGWAVGFYFIPIMSWFKPFQAMDEIDRASRTPESWRAQKTRALLWIWWGAWVITGVGGTVLRIVGSAGAADTVEFVGYASLGLTLIGLAASICYFVIVLTIHRAQAESRARGANLAQVFA